MPGCESMEEWNDSRSSTRTGADKMGECEADLVNPRIRGRINELHSRHMFEFCLSVIGSSFLRK